MLNNPMEPTRQRPMRSCHRSARLISDVTQPSDPTEVIQADHGFSIIDYVFTPAEMRQALGVLSVVDLDRTKAGARHILSVGVVRELALDPRMVQIARQFVGSGATPFRATLFDKSGRANGAHGRLRPVSSMPMLPPGPWSTW
jgi:hypothetical protein